MKSLIKKFSYNGLVKESEKQGWVIPTMAEVEASDIIHDIVWVSDVASERDEPTHGILYNKKTGNWFIANKTHLHHVVVIKKKCKADCATMDIVKKGFIYCPYCGKELE